MNDRLKNLLKRIEGTCESDPDEKNESIFNICVNQIVKLYSLNPTFGGMVKAKIVQFMMSKQMFQRQLAAALFENLVEPVHEHVSQFLNDTAANEQMTSVFAVEPFAEILGEKTSDFDKIVETSMKDLDLDAMVLHIKNAQNYLYSRDEKVARPHTVLQPEQEKQDQRDRRDLRDGPDRRHGDAGRAYAGRVG